MSDRTAKARKSRHRAARNVPPKPLTPEEKQARAEKEAEILQENRERVAKAARQLELLSPVIHHYCAIRADACRMVGVPYGAVAVGTPAGNELPDHIRSTEMRLDSRDNTCFISPTRSAMERGAEREIRHAFHEAKRQEREADAKAASVA